MTCRATKGCERHVLDPFVSNLNWLEGTRFEHHECLYLHRNHPQPEEVYRDENSGVRLVIERKSIAWPSDYEQRHANDHLLHELLVEELQDLPLTSAHALELPYLFRGTKRDVQEFARQIASRIRQEFSNLERGEAIGSRDKNQPWRLYEQEPWQIEEDVPPNAFVAIWNVWEECRGVSPDPLPKQLRVRLNGLFEAAAKKFQGWEDCRKILLIEQFGRLRLNRAGWWAKVLATQPPPQNVDEVWLAEFDWVTETETDWMFNKLWQASKR